MPLIKRSPFQTVKKPPKRRTASLPNISNLDETQYSLNDFKIDGGPVVLKLGAQELVFDNGQWNSSSATKPLQEDINVGSKDARHLQKQNLKLSEENNLLKYKVELLMDMLAASNADVDRLQKELQAYKRSLSQRQ
jgi:hypothetical protein